MAKDLTIRLIGRPKVSQDSQLGFQRIARKYIVQGPRASKAGIEDVNNPLFLPVGTADEEFTDHYLVNQAIEPTSSMDKANLTRDFVEIRDTYNSESSSESGDLKRITRKYIVLRAQHARGYDVTSWANHPFNSGGRSNDPWDYLPSAIKNTEPTSVSYTDTGSVNVSIFNASNSAPSSLGTPSVSIASTSTTLSTALQAAASTDSLSIKWVRATVQVDSSNPGVDVWSVSWVAPVTDHWAVGNGKSGSSSQKLPAMMKFDHNGIRTFKFGTSGAGGPTIMYSYVSYIVGVDPGTTLTSYFGTGTVNPSVSMDFQLIGIDGNHRSASFRQSAANTFLLQDTSQYLKFPKAYFVDAFAREQPSVKVGFKEPHKIVFSFQSDMDAAGDPNYDLPHYQGSPIMQAGGNLSFSHTFIMNSSSGSSLIGSSIKPIFSHGSERIWKIVLTYVG